MYKNLKISLYMPCRNEANHLPEIIQNIPKYVDEIIIVSNKSTDNTVKVAKKLGLKTFEDNRTIKGIGYGYAHMTGIANAKGDIIVAADGDGTYPVEKIDKAIDFMMNNGLDFVACNRYPLRDGTKIPFKLRFGVGLLNKEARLLYGYKFKDILSGMWLFKREIKPKLKLSAGDWNLSPQIKVNAAKHPEIAYGEFHIPQHQRHGSSHQSYFKTGFSHMFWLLGNAYDNDPVSKADKPERSTSAD